MKEFLSWLAENPAMTGVVVTMLGLGISGLVVAIGAWLYPWLKWKRQGYPGEEQIEAALLPFMLEAICLAYRLSERALDETGERLHGVDKKRLADWLWNALPDEVVIPLGPFHYTFRPKEVLDKESWSEWVQWAMNKIITRYEMLIEGYEDAFLRWLVENADEPVHTLPII